MPRVRFQMSEKSVFIFEAELIRILQQKSFWKAVQMGVENLEVNSLASNYAQVTLKSSGTFNCTTVNNAFWILPFSHHSGFSNWPPWALLQCRPDFPLSLPSEPKLQIPDSHHLSFILEKHLYFRESDFKEALN